MPTLSVWGPLGAPTEKPPLPPFPRPQAWKLAAQGRLNGPGNKAPEQFKDRARPGLKFSSRIQGEEGFSSASL